MRSRVTLPIVALVLSGCSLFEATPKPVESTPDVTSEQTAENPEPEAAVAPPPSARTAEQFDTTTDKERADAIAEAKPAAGDKSLGRTVASLGAVTEPGIWIKTPLSTSARKGRVDYPAKGTSVAVDIIPLDAERGSGSRLSLAAMRLLDADLTALPEVEVFAAD